MAHLALSRSLSHGHPILYRSYLMSINLSSSRVLNRVLDLQSQAFPVHHHPQRWCLPTAILLRQAHCTFCLDHGMSVPKSRQEPSCL